MGGSSSMPMQGAGQATSNPLSAMPDQAGFAPPTPTSPTGFGTAGLPLGGVQNGPLNPGTTMSSLGGQTPTAPQPNLQPIISALTQPESTSPLAPQQPQQQPMTMFGSSAPMFVGAQSNPLQTIVQALQGGRSG